MAAIEKLPLSNLRMLFPTAAETATAILTIFRVISFAYPPITPEESLGGTAAVKHEAALRRFDLPGQDEGWIRGQDHCGSQSLRSRMILSSFASLRGKRS